jgi:hypothetical protein
MTRELFEQRLAQTDAADDLAVMKLVSEYTKEGGEGLDAVVRYAQDEAFTGPKARSILGRLEETAVQPLSRAISRKPEPDFGCCSGW